MMMMMLPTCCNHTVHSVCVSLRYLVASAHIDLPPVWWQSFTHPFSPSPSSQSVASSAVTAAVLSKQMTNELFISTDWLVVVKGH